MCRWMAYKGAPVKLDLLLTFPENSLTNQAKNAEYHPGCQYSSERVAAKRNCRVNADGFGIAWYGVEQVNRATSCVFRSIMPSWGDVNLREIASHVRSGSVFAHIRAMTHTGEDPLVGSVCIPNCHPFKWGSYTFMHNGGVQNFIHMKRKLQAQLDDDFFRMVAGSTDSENIFALFLTRLRRVCAAGDAKSNTTTASGDTIASDENLSPLPSKRSYALVATPDQIALAMHQTIQQVVDLICDTRPDSACSLNFAVTDGTCTVATRFRRGRSDPPSLYFAALKEIQTSTVSDGPPRISCVSVEETKNRTRLDNVNSVIVSSEPLTKEPCWNLLNDKTMIVIHGDPDGGHRAGRVDIVPLNVRAPPLGDTPRSDGGRCLAEEPETEMPPLLLARVLSSSRRRSLSETPPRPKRCRRAKRGTPGTPITRSTPERAAKLNQSSTGECKQGLDSTSRLAQIAASMGSDASPLTTPPTPPTPPSQPTQPTQPSQPTSGHTSTRSTWSGLEAAALGIAVGSSGVLSPVWDSLQRLLSRRAAWWAMAALVVLAWRWSRKRGGALNGSLDIKLRIDRTQVALALVALSLFRNH